MRNFQNIGQLVKFLLAHFTFIDNNGIVKVATFDKVCLQQRNDVAYKHKCSCCSNLRVESRHILQGGKLTVDKLGVKWAHCSQTELVIGQNSDHRPRVFIFYFNLMTNDIIVFRSILFNKTYFLYLLNIHCCRTVKNRKFRAIDLNDTVIYARGIKCSHTVFYGRNADISLCKNRSTLCVDHIFSYGINNRLTFYVNSLYFISGIFGCGIECNSKVQTRM